MDINSGVRLLHMSFIPFLHNFFYAVFVFFVDFVRKTLYYYCKFMCFA